MRYVSCAHNIAHIQLSERYEICSQNKTQNRNQIFAGKVTTTDALNLEARVQG